MATAITITVFDDAEVWLKENLADICGSLDGVSAVYPEEWLDEEKCVVLLRDHEDRQSSVDLKGWVEALSP